MFSALSYNKHVNLDITLKLTKGSLQASYIDSSALASIELRVLIAQLDRTRILCLQRVQSSSVPSHPRHAFVLAGCPHSKMGLTVVRVVDSCAYTSIFHEIFHQIFHQAKDCATVCGKLSRNLQHYDLR